MLVKLVRHTFPDRPDWVLIEESVPIGTIYEVYGFDRDFVIMNHLLKEARPISAFLLKRNDEMGWLPTVCFERIEDEGQECSKSSAQIQES
jgi:hypothetical protein